ncbi:MAG: PilZ domain-containing protein [Deltaproteobacteria bacterium]|nr:PilZ domain-containing protein [Deltaproteobacteria bacterium]
MKGTGEKQPDKAKSKITRHVFRLPVDEEDNISVELNGSTYEVINIGTNGVGILVDEENSFAVEQNIGSIRLNLSTGLLHLQGRVVHVSPRDFQLICGIEFVQMDPETEEKILSFLRRHRETLFGGK